MIVVDASCLFEIVAGSADAELIRRRLSSEIDQVAPHVIDIEVSAIIRREWLRGRFDDTRAALAIENLRSWPGERFGHQGLLARCWELRDSVRSWDATYVALAEALDAPLVTRDHRLARADGPTCVIETI